MASSHGVALYIDPPSPHFFGDRLFESSTVATLGDNLMAPWIALQAYFMARGISIHTSDLLPEREDRVQKIFISTGLVSDFRRVAQRGDVVLSAHFAMECPIVEPYLYAALPDAQKYFRRIFTWSDANSLQPFTRAAIRCESFRWPQSYDRVHEELWNRMKRGFLVMINSNKLPRLYTNELYTQRLRAVEFFHRYGEIDLYGPNWDRMPTRVGKSWVPMSMRRLYRVSGVEETLWRLRQSIRPDPLYRAAAAASHGIAKSKSETLSRYTFALCFENMLLKGWMTEKIFDCLFTGTIPIYWGAPDVLDYVPADCFIDMRRFGEFSELRAFLHDLSPAEIDRYREAGRDFLASSQFDPFRKSAFVDLFRRIVREDAAVAV